MVLPSIMPSTILFCPLFSCHEVTPYSFDLKKAVFATFFLGLGSGSQAARPADT